MQGKNYIEIGKEYIASAIGRLEELFLEDGDNVLKTAFIKPSGKQELVRYLSSIGDGGKLHLQRFYLEGCIKKIQEQPQSDKGDELVAKLEKVDTCICALDLMAIKEQRVLVDYGIIEEGDGESVRTVKAEAIATLAKNSIEQAIKRNTPTERQTAQQRIRDQENHQAHPDHWARREVGGAVSEIALARAKQKENPAGSGERKSMGRE